MFQRLRSSSGLGVGLAVAILVAGCAPWAGAAQLRQVTERVFPFDPGGELIIQSQNGRISVEAWDRPEVRVQITRVVRAGDDRRAEALMNELRADVSLGKGTIAIVSKYPKRSESVGIWDVLGQRVTSLNINYYVQVPARTRLDLETSNGELQIRGTAGSLTARTVNGDVEVTSVQGRVEVNTTNGHIRLVRIEGSAHAGTTNGGIEAELRKLSARGEVELATTNGNVVAVLPERLNATVEAMTTNGRVSVSYPLEKTGFTSSKTVQGKIGGGGALVKLRTTNGNIALKKVGAGRRS